MAFSNSATHVFVSPPAAPTFVPTEEEFRDPLAYLEKIRPVAENYGVIKIKPPPNWQPPFMIDVDEKEFEPRVQKLNELDGLSRVRLNFVDRIAKFWNLQGIVLRIPVIEGKALDLHRLHQVVENMGGFERCTKEKLWGSVARTLSIQPVRASLLRDHYQKLLLPFDVYRSGLALKHVMTGGETEKLKQRKPVIIVKEETPVMSKQVEKQLRRLQAYGAGKKFPGLPQMGSKSQAFPSTSKQQPESPSDANVEYVDPMDYVCCKVCMDGGNEDRLLLCEKCDGSFHTYCLLPPLKSVPAGDWLCPKCVTEEVTKPPEAYGFQQAAQKYTLRMFGKMADEFKEKYFGMPCHAVPLKTVEREFWHLVSDDADPISVEYGADLLSSEFGSGFPTKDSQNLLPQEQQYVNSPWNLNNIPNLPMSALAYIDPNISGMKVPWVYVGMCFSTFCWHTEDHWSYSINYLHWGEPKTWYGISGLDAVEFECAMKRIAPELFDSQPDLLHHLVTIINPQLLIEHGVKVYSVMQCAGEFVVTFPRSYHAGFNQGYNCAEAVNICPSDWLAKGRQCIDHYASLRRLCVFSHDEMILQMAANAAQMDVSLACAVYHDMETMVSMEQQLRDAIKPLNLRQQLELFENFADDDRVCQICRTTLFLSSVSCSCNELKQVCLKDIRNLCLECPPKNWVLNIRYTIGELKEKLILLKARIATFEEWSTVAKRAFTLKGDSRIDVSTLKALIDEARSNRFPKTVLLSKLETQLETTNRWAQMAEQLVSQKIRSRHAMEFYQAIDLARATVENEIDQFSCKASLDDLQAFSNVLNKLICRIPQQGALDEFIYQVRQFMQECDKYLDSLDAWKGSSDCMLHEQRLKFMFDRAVAFDLQLPQVTRLKKLLDCLNWLKSTAEVTEQRKIITKDRLEEIIKIGTSLSPAAIIEQTMSKLVELQTKLQENEKKAQALLFSKMPLNVNDLKAELKSLEEIPVEQPKVALLYSILRKMEDSSLTLRDFVANGCTLYRLEKFLKNLSGMKWTPGLDSNALARSRNSLAQLSNLFRLPDSPCKSLYDAITPRVSLEGVAEITVEGDAMPYDDWGALEKFDSVDQVTRALSQMETSELQAITKHREMRERLLSSARSTDNYFITEPFCFCEKQRSQRGLVKSNQLLHCWVCFDVFHVDCVSALRHFSSRPVGIYVCRQCWRTKRPSFQTFNDRFQIVVDERNRLSSSLKLFELEVFSFLHRRATSWAMEAQNFLKSAGDLAPSVTPAFLATLENIFLRGLLLELQMPELMPVLQYATRFLPFYTKQHAIMTDLLKRPFCNGQGPLTQVVIAPVAKRPVPPAASSGGPTDPKVQREALCHESSEQRPPATCKLRKGIIFWKLPSQVNVVRRL